MFNYQLDLFEPVPTEMDILRAEMEHLRESCNNMRKGLFARQNGLGKELFREIDDLKAEINRLHILLKNK